MWKFIFCHHLLARFDYFPSLLTFFSTLLYLYPKYYNHGSFCLLHFLTGCSPGAVADLCPAHKTIDLTEGGSTSHLQGGGRMEKVALLRSGVGSTAQDGGGGETNGEIT